MEKTNYNNVNLCGSIDVEPEYNHELYGEKFYKMTLEISRISGAVDYIPVMVSDRLVDINSLVKGTMVSIEGEYRSFNHTEEGSEKRKLILNVFATSLSFENEGEGKNDIYLNGYICKKPIKRTTPLGREIADVLLAVNRAYGKSDYIPCICWGRNSNFVAGLEIGANIEVRGRIQSRVYTKDKEEKVAYEVSVGRIEAAS